MTGPADWLRAAVRAVPPYTPGEQPGPGQRVIKLNTNENPYPPSEAVLRSAPRRRRRAGAPVSRPRGDGLRAAASRLYGIPTDHILAGNGSDELLTLLLRALVEPGEQVAFPVPTYSLYETLVSVQGGVLVELPWPSDWSLPSGLSATRAPSSRSSAIRTPRRVRSCRSARSSALARRIPGVLVVDEAYVDFAREHALALVGRPPNVVVLRTLSKSYSSLAGLRVGLAFAVPELLRGLRTVKDSTT